MYGPKCVCCSENNVYFCEGYVNGWAYLLVWCICMEMYRVNGDYMEAMDLFRFCPVCGSAEFNRNNDSSKRCRRCGFVYYFNPRASVAVFIVNEKGELLVGRRAKAPAKGTLDLPGGFTEYGETVEEAVRREVKEETGLDVREGKYLFSLPNVYPYSGLNVHTMDLFFECRVDTTEHLSAMDDVAELFFVPMEKLDPDLFGLLSVRKGVEIYLSDHQKEIL